jgi:PKD repeat protein
LKKKRDIETIEELFSEKFRNYSLDPGDAFRVRLERKLHYREFMRFIPTRLNIWYVAAAVTVATVVTALLLTEKTASYSPDLPEVGDNISEQFDAVAVREKDSVDKRQVVSYGSLSASEKIETIDVTSVASGSEPDTSRNVKINNAVVPDIKERKKAEPVPALTLKELTPVQAPLSRFISSNISGCEPLTVSFENISHNYDSCVWDFGDGGFSTEDNPVWIFDEKGEYRVTLLVFGPGEKISGSSEVITVHGKPLARFEIDADKALNEGEVVRFYNYSENAVSWDWRFGDGEKSSLYEPDHRYTRPGSYTITLTVRSQFGCTDSVTVTNAFDDNSCYIKFPNVFIPNAGGPAGGYYSNRSDQNSEVFHPVWSGVTDYQLRIFSRLGILVFETSDIEIGWDGYIRGEKAEPGVYIWKVRGVFMNGEPFVKAGDVTILPNQ